MSSLGVARHDLRLSLGNAVTAKRLKSKACYRYRVTGSERRLSFPSTFGQKTDLARRGVTGIGHLSPTLSRRCAPAWQDQLVLPDRGPGATSAPVLGRMYSPGTGGKLGVPSGIWNRKFE
jgi:hypothetical protein